MSGIPVTSEPGLRYDYVLDPDGDTSGARLLRLTGHGKRVLDLGCAAGALDRVLVERGCQVVGWEYDRDAAKLAEQVCERVIVADLDTADLDLELGDDRFDVIVAGDVLEHLRDPGALLRRLPEFLRPGGWLALSVPNVAHGSIRLALLHGDFPRSETGLLDDTHRQFLTRETVTTLLEDNGWTLLHLDATRLDPRASEVPFARDEVTARAMPDVEADPDSFVYQWVALAVPGAVADLDALPALLRRLWQQQDQRVRFLEGELAASQVHAKNVAAVADHFQTEHEKARLQVLALRDDAVRADRRRTWLEAHLQARQDADALTQEQFRRVGRELAEVRAQLAHTEQALQTVLSSTLVRGARLSRRVVGRARRLVR